MSSPIFIVGANRSGTTLLRLILNAHPRIAIPDELIYFHSRLADTPIERWREPDLSPSAYEAFVDHFLATSCTPLEELDKQALRKRILDGPHNFRTPYRCALAAWADHYGKERWGEKTPGNLFYADIILEMFPDAQFLYMVHDPRAGVASMNKVSFFPDDTVFNALSRRKHDLTGRTVLHEHVPASQRKRIRYEDLVREPEAVMQSICQFLDEPFTARMLQFHRDADDYMKEAAEENYNAAATHPITDDHVDSWTDQLSANQIEMVESICAPVMERFDYEPVSPSSSVLTAPQVLIKWAYWTYQCWRHREIRHYTVKHPLFARTRSRLSALSLRVQTLLPSIFSDR